MKVRNWGESKDGLFEFKSMTRDTLEGGLNVMRRSFFIYESAMTGVELHKDREAELEIEELCIDATKDGVSLVAIEKKTQRVVGVAFNKLQVQSEGPSYFEKVAANCEHESSKCAVQFMIDADAVVDLFALTKAKCILELMFTSVLPEFWRKGIARKLFEISITIAENLNAGLNVKVPMDNEPLPLEPIPNILSGIMTAESTQKLAESLNFVRVVEISFKNFLFRGETFASRIGSDSPYSTIDYYTVKTSNSLTQ